MAEPRRLAVETRGLAGECPAETRGPAAECPAETRGPAAESPAEPRHLAAETRGLAAETRVTVAPLFTALIRVKWRRRDPEEVK